MSQSNSKQIIARSYNGESHGIQYANQEKISLDLRKLRFESEISQKGYPSDQAEAINRLIQVRADEIEGRYEQIMLYIYLQRFGSFWEDFGFKSPDAWMAHFDLPHGETLARRVLLVELFSRETFILLGDDILGEMTFLIARAQKDPAKKKTDYQNIFELYCKLNDSFDKTEFRKILNQYVNRTYPQKGIEIEDEHARPPRQLPKGVQSVKVAKPVAEIVRDEPEDAPTADLPSLPETTMDFVIETRLCAGCRARDAYITRLERVITDSLGAGQLPERPRDI